MMSKRTWEAQRKETSFLKAKVRRTMPVQETGPQLREKPPKFWNLQLCEHMNRCSFGQRCKYAHSLSEIEKWMGPTQDIIKKVNKIIIQWDIYHVSSQISEEKIGQNEVRLVLDLLLAKTTEEYNKVSAAIDDNGRARNIQTAMHFLNIFGQHIRQFKHPTTMTFSDKMELTETRKLLDTIRHEQGQRMPGEGKRDQQIRDLIYCNATILVSICYRIEHQELLKDTLVFKPELFGSNGFMRSLFKYGIEMVDCLNALKGLGHTQEEMWEINRERLVKMKDEFEKSCAV